ncbi:MAG: ATP-dependent RecD-like DNA helicase, partial [Flavobacterium sp.]
MSSDLFSRYLTQNFPFQPTIHQQKFFQRISEYVIDNRNNTLFLLTGYAGTGKTTVISTLVNGLPEIKMKAVLMAPTGRAAKVMSGYSGRIAYTIHRKIYHPRKKPDGGVVFTLQQNKHKNTLFIVDESSMIADSSTDSGGYQSGSLLNDLMRYVASGTGCKLLLVGDTAQLPPVGLPHSPALDPDYLQLHFQT